MTAFEQSVGGAENLANTKRIFGQYFDIYHLLDDSNKWIIFAKEIIMQKHENWLLQDQYKTNF